jgi:pimeloyl-ACP methyl ester carboxylesterase
VVVDLYSLTGPRGGFGDSDIPPAGYDLATGADDLHAYITQLGLSGPGGIDIVSHDIGSWIAHAHAVKYPGDVCGMTARSSYCRATPILGRSRALQALWLAAE